MNDDGPFYFVSLIYVGFDCDKCLAYECANPNSPEETALAAKEKGWHAVMDDKCIKGVVTLCPNCKE